MKEPIFVNLIYQFIMKSVDFILFEGLASNSLIAHAHRRSCCPEAFVERQILGVKISAHVIQLWHAHCKRLDAPFKIHNALV